MAEPHILIIGYGNTLRSDDGVGYRVAEAIAQQVEDGTLKQVRSRPVHQLLPELADEIAQAKAVIVVDAATPELQLTNVQLQPITPAPPESQLGHSQGARSLLFLAQTLYGAAPPAYWILIPTENMEFGETFSDRTQRGFTQSLNNIHQLVNEILRNETYIHTAY
jgi:hydrogenase maturation protease